MTRKELKQMRDENLINRYHELFEVQRIRQDDVLKMLCDKFYLSERKIKEIVRNSKK